MESLNEFLANQILSPCIIGLKTFWLLPTSKWPNKGFHPTYYTYLARHIAIQKVSTVLIISSFKYTKVS